MEAAMSDRREGNASTISPATMMALGLMRSAAEPRT